MQWQTLTAKIVQGHRVASGLNGNPLFPGGTLLMQTPIFKELGFDLSAYHRGTLNVSIAPWRYRVIHSPLTLRQVRWHPTEPPEDFSFFDMELVRPGCEPVAGKIYFPHPDTKPAHFQKPDVLEIILPWVKGLGYGMEIQLRVPGDQMLFERDTGEA